MLVFIAISSLIGGFVGVKLLAGSIYEYFGGSPHSAWEGEGLAAVSVLIGGLLGAALFGLGSYFLAKVVI